MTFPKFVYGKLRFTFRSCETEGFDQHLSRFCMVINEAVAVTGSPDFEYFNGLEVAPGGITIIINSAFTFDYPKGVMFYDLNEDIEEYLELAQNEVIFERAKVYFLEHDPDELDLETGINEENIPAQRRVFYAREIGWCQKIDTVKE